MMKTFIPLLIFVGFQQFLFAQEIPFSFIPFLTEKTSKSQTPTADISAMTCDTVATFATEFNIPIGLTWDGTNFWTNDYPTGDGIYRMNTAGEILDSIPLPDIESQGALAFDGEHLLLVALRTGKLYRLDREDGAIINEWQLPSLTPSSPRLYGLAFDGDFIWCGHYTPGILFKVDPVSGDVVDSYDLPVSLGGLYATRNHILGWGIVNGNDTEKFYVFDKTEESFVDSMVICDRDFLDLTFDGNNVWAYTFSSDVAERLYQFESSVFPLISSTESISQAELKPLTVFPNPTSDQITITVDYIDNIKIVDAWGKEIFPDLNDKVLDLSIAPAGIYFIIVNHGAVRQMAKVVKL